MYKKWYGSLFFFLLFFLFPSTAEASHYGLTVKQQQEALKPYRHFYQAAFSNQDENKYSECTKFRDSIERRPSAWKRTRLLTVLR